MEKKIIPALYAHPHPVAFKVACSLVGLLLGRVLVELTGRFFVLVICKGQRKQLDLERMNHLFSGTAFLQGLLWCPGRLWRVTLLYFAGLLTLATWDRLETPIQPGST